MSQKVRATASEGEKRNLTGFQFVHWWHKACDCCQKVSGRRVMFSQKSKEAMGSKSQGLAGVSLPLSRCPYLLIFISVSWMYRSTLVSVGSRFLASRR